MYWSTTWTIIFSVNWYMGKILFLFYSAFFVLWVSFLDFEVLPDTPNALDNLIDLWVNTRSHLLVITRFIQLFFFCSFIARLSLITDFSGILSGHIAGPGEGSGQRHSRSGAQGKERGKQVREPSTAEQGHRIGHVLCPGHLPACRLH